MIEDEVSPSPPACRLCGSAARLPGAQWQDGRKVQVLRDRRLRRSRAMSVEMEEKYGVHVLHAWGMTEMSPLGTVNWPKYGMEGESDEGPLQPAGQAGPTVLRHRHENRQRRQRNPAGRRRGVRRIESAWPWVCSEYYRGEGDNHDADGWFATGDVATIDSDGYMHVTDRSKDVIKSGGEWISSIELENIAVGHPGVFEAAVIGVRHPKWDERPLLVVVLNEDSEVTAEELLTYYVGKVAKWWIPDDVAFVNELPHTATGKLLKMIFGQLRGLRTADGVTF